MSAFYSKEIMFKTTRHTVLICTYPQRLYGYINTIYCLLSKLLDALFIASSSSIMTIPTGYTSSLSSTTTTTPWYYSSTTTKQPPTSTYAYSSESEVPTTTTYPFSVYSSETTSENNVIENLLTVYKKHVENKM